jgi:hypothetical protein
MRLESKQRDIIHRADKANADGDDIRREGDGVPRSTMPRRASGVAEPDSRVEDRFIVVLTSRFVSMRPDGRHFDVWCFDRCRG